MKNITAKQLLETLQSRYATKEFDPSKKVSTSDWDALEESLVLTPSSFGLQPWKFIVVTDQATKDSLVEHSWGQKQVADCSQMIVLCAKKQMTSEDTEAWLQRIVEVRGVSRESLDGYAGMMDGVFSHMSVDQQFVWAKNQVYIALGQLMASAALLGIDACPLEGIINSEYDRILKLEDSDYATVVACPIGYRAASDKYAEIAKVRYTGDQVIEKI